MSSKQVAEENTCYWWTNNSFQRTGNQSTICRRLLPFFCFFPAVPGQFCILHFAYIYTAYAVVKLQFITIGGSCNYRPSQYKHGHKHKYKCKHRHKYKYKIKQDNAGEYWQMCVLKTSLVYRCNQLQRLTLRNCHQTLKFYICQFYVKILLNFKLSNSMSILCQNAFTKSVFF